MSVLTTEFEGTTYAIVRGSDGSEPIVAVIFMPGSAPHDWVPLDVIRSVCTNLGLGPDIFKVKH